MKYVLVVTSSGFNIGNLKHPRITIKKIQQMIDTYVFLVDYIDESCVHRLLHDLHQLHPHFRYSILESEEFDEIKNNLVV